MNKLLLSFDIEEFDLPQEYGRPVAENDKFEMSRAGTETILDVVNSAGIRATFFVTGMFAARYPELIKKWLPEITKSPLTAWITHPLRPGI